MKITTSFDCVCLCVFLSAWLIERQRETVQHKRAWLMRGSAINIHISSVDGFIIHIHFMCEHNYTGHNAVKSQSKKRGGAFGRVFYISVKDTKEVELQRGKEANEWNSGKACALSLCLAACVININSTKWAVIKLSRVVNDPQRQNWNMKGARARMHRRRRTFSHFLCAPTACHLHNQTRTCGWFPISWAIRNTVADR